jgi:hypothetical protein
VRLLLGMLCWWFSAAAAVALLTTTAVLLFNCRRACCWATCVVVDFLCHAVNSHCCVAMHLQVRLLLGMLCASPWRYYPLTLQFLSQQHSSLPKGEQQQQQECCRFLCRVCCLHRTSTASNLASAGATAEVA